MVLLFCPHDGDGFELGEPYIVFSLTGILRHHQYNNTESLTKFQAWIDHDDDSVSVDENEIAAWQKEFPQAYRRDEYLGLYADVHGGPEEPDNGYIQELAKNGLRNLGHHGAVSAMGVPLTELPRWVDIQILTGQLARPPLLDDEPVTTELIMGLTQRSRS